MWNDKLKKGLGLFAVFLCMCGCVTTTNRSTGGQKHPNVIGASELDRASAALLVQFLTDGTWNRFAANYTAQIREKHPDATPLETVPLMFVSQVTNSLRTEAGNPLNYSNVTDKLLFLLQNPHQLDRFIRLELKSKYPTLYEELRAYMAQATGNPKWTWQGVEPLPRIQISKYLGIEAEKAVEGIEFIVTDPRTEKKNIREGLIEIPALALSFKMEPYGSDQLKFTATITDFLAKVGSTKGSALVVWNAYVQIEK